MLSPREEEYILKNAKVPEHIPALMAGVSQADLFLVGPFLCLAKDDWLTFVGYPLEGDFSEDSFSFSLEKAMALTHPLHTWFITPKIPASLASRVKSQEVDYYYRLDLQPPQINKELSRKAEKAAQDLSVRPSRFFSDEHVLLTEEFLQRQQLPLRVSHLYLRMKDYLAFSETSLLLTARDRENRLSAYYILELGAEKFLTYVVGCHSKKNYVPHASDLLFYKMISLAREKGKAYIHLGLGVNEGIRRFKKKWGGVPELPYFAGEITPGGKTILSCLRALASKI